MAHIQSLKFSKLPLLGLLLLITIRIASLISSKDCIRSLVKPIETTLLSERETSLILAFWSPFSSNKSVTAHLLKVLFILLLRKMLMNLLLSRFSILKITSSARLICSKSCRNSLNANPLYFHQLQQSMGSKITVLSNLIAYQSPLMGNLSFQLK